MSESDLYRKQRVAIAEVAKALTDLEQNGTGTSGQADGDDALRVAEESHLDNPY
jgi:hypothetical protein